MSSTLDHGHPDDLPCDPESCGHPPCEQDDDGCWVRDVSPVFGDPEGPELCPCDWHKP